MQPTQSLLFSHLIPLLLIRQVGLEPIIAAFIPLAGPVLAAIFGFYIILLSLIFGISTYDVARMVR
jgi:hypothetical protein